MKRGVGRLWIVGFFGFVAAADAQTLSPSGHPVTAFDGTYAFVSSAKVNETYSWTETHSGSGRCPDLRQRFPLSIVNGHARYGLQEGTVGPQGELVMRELILHSFGHSEIVTSGRIDGNGTVRARRIAYNCSHDLIWQKVQVQSPSFPIASAQFDGTYAFASSTRVNQTYGKTATGQTGECPERRAGTLIIINGRAHLPSFEGTVGSHGDLVMLRIPESFGEIPGVGGIVAGTIEKDGTVKARRILDDCNYDTIWRRESG